MSTAIDLSGLTADQLDLVEQFVRTLRSGGADRRRAELLRRWDARGAALPPLPEEDVEALVREEIRAVRDRR